MPCTPRLVPRFDPREPTPCTGLAALRGPGAIQGQGLPSAGSQASRAPSRCTNGRRAREPRGSPWPSPTQTATTVCGAISSCFHTLSSLVAESQEGPHQTLDTRNTSAAGHNVKMRSVDARACTGLHAFARACTGLHRFAHICTAGRAKAPQLGLKGLRHSDRDCPQDTRWQSHAPRSLGTSSEAALGGDSANPRAEPRDTNAQCGRNSWGSSEKTTTGRPPPGPAPELTMAGPPSADVVAVRPATEGSCTAGAPSPLRGWGPQAGTSLPRPGRRSEGAACAHD